VLPIILDMFISMYYREWVT